MWPGDEHFEQVMKTRGELELRGKRYAVDGHQVRGGSWGCQPRPEQWGDVQDVQYPDYLPKNG